MKRESKEGLQHRESPLSNSKNVPNEILLFCQFNGILFFAVQGIFFNIKTQNKVVQECKTAKASYPVGPDSNSLYPTRLQLSYNFQSSTTSKASRNEWEKREEKSLKKNPNLLQNCTVSHVNLKNLHLPTWHTETGGHSLPPQI